MLDVKTTIFHQRSKWCLFKCAEHL